MKALRLAVVALMVVTMAVFFWHYRLGTKARHENQSLRARIEQIEARNNELSRPVPQTSNSPSVLDQSRELIKLRGEVTTLRSERDELLQQLAVKATPPAALLEPVNKAWVQQVLDSTPRNQGIAAGTLRGKLLRREMTNVSPSELALQGELLKRQLNQSLERSPIEFADFQTSFIQNALSISDESRIPKIHDLIQRSYEQAIASGLDIPSKPVTGIDEWVDRRFTLDRAATAQLKELLTPDERDLFDRAFLGVMGVDLGGVGVDKSNYPKGFLGE